jgi:hypothetical protein
VGQVAEIDVHVGHDTYQGFRAVVHEHGTLRTQAGGNSWYVSWRLLASLD